MDMKEHLLHSLLVILMSSPVLILSLERYSPDGSYVIYTEYDYVIVGGGAAGSVVASRLSEIPCVSVLVIEAGSKPAPTTEVPLLSLATWFTDMDWQYRSVPQKHAGNLMKNNEFPLTSGRALGGGSSIGDMIYSRGNKQNYDDWASMGADGWSYDDVFPYFLKLEDNADEEYLSNGYHHAGGPQTVHKPRYQSKFKEVLRGSLSELGYPFVDSTGARQTGVQDFQATLRDSRRCSTAKGYLVPAEDRPNLDILLNAMVKKIVIEDQTATGVEFDYGSHTYQVRAKQEVILSAGTMATPQLLMLSGIGPRCTLENHNIPVVADLPVGEDFQDHAGIPVFFQLSPLHPSIILKTLSPISILQYIIFGTGPYASIAFQNFMAYLKGDEIDPIVDIPNYELALLEITTAALGIPYFGYTLEGYEKYLGAYDFKPLFMCLVQVIQPKSRGFITLKSGDVYDHPLIDPNFFADPSDVKDAVEGIKTCHKIAATKAMQTIGARPMETVVPGCENFVDDEDAYFGCMARSTLISIHHPVGTAKMGDPSDPTTVVDPTLRVKNVNNLRVVDASIMPTIVSGNTGVPVIMIAEKASDMIKESVQCLGQSQKKCDGSRDVLLHTNPLASLLTNLKGIWSNLQQGLLKYIV